MKRAVEQDQPAKRLTTEHTRRLIQQQLELEQQRTQHALQTLHEQQERERQCRLVYGNFLYALEFAEALELAPDHLTPYQVMVDNTAYEELHQLQLERRTEQLQEHLEQQASELDREHLEEQLEHLGHHREQERIDIQLEQHLEQRHLEQQQDEKDDTDEEEFASLDRSLQEIIHEPNVKPLVV